MSILSPCLWFNDNAEAAIAVYTALVPGTAVTQVSRQPDGSAVVVDFTLGGLSFMALNGGPANTPNPSISFFLECTEVDVAAQLFAGVADGGTVRMSLCAYPWAPCFGWVDDRFGVSWQVIAVAATAPGGPTVRCVPNLMFFGDPLGCAAEAIAHDSTPLEPSRAPRKDAHAADATPTDMAHGHGQAWAL